VPALPLQAKYRKDHISNSIIDSGTSDLTLAADVFDGILKALNRLNPKFTALIRAARSKHRADAAALNLPAWPDLHFILAGERGEDIRLTCTPRTYWQVDFPAAGRAAFQLSGPLGEAHQSILGLPLLNNYYTVFDRSAHSHGVVRFAPIKGR